jgi:hypothetical protein
MITVHSFTTDLHILAENTVLLTSYILIISVSQSNFSSWSSSERIRELFDASDPEIFYKDLYPDPGLYGYKGTGNTKLTTLRRLWHTEYEGESEALLTACYRHCQAALAHQIRFESEGLLTAYYRHCQAALAYRIRGRVGGFTYRMLPALPSGSDIPNTRESRRVY